MYTKWYEWVEVYYRLLLDCIAKVNCRKELALILGTVVGLGFLGNLR
jgi:hypothetical protein